MTGFSTACYGANYVIWLAPDERCQNTILTLTDRGIRVVVVGTETFSPLQQRYRLVSSKAVSLGLRQWRREGVRPVIAACSKLAPTALRNERVEALLSEAGEVREFRGGSTEDLLRYLRSLDEGEDGTGIIFARIAFQQLVCHRAPEELFSLMRNRRVMFAHGAPSLWGVDVPSVPVSVVSMDGLAICEIISRDLESGAAFDTSASPTLLCAQWRPNVPLSELVR